MKLNYNGDRLDDEKVEEIVATDEIYLFKDKFGDAWLHIYGEEINLSVGMADKLSQALSLAVSVGFFENEGE